MTRQESSASAIGDVTVETAYRQHLPAIVRYLRRRLGDDIAEDAAADVFARAMRSERAGQAVSLPWLFGVAANVISEHRRSERRRLRAIERLAAHAPSEHPPVEIASALDPALIRALRRLDRGDREALLLVAWGELTYEQTAEALDVPVGTVRSRIFRARKQLSPSAARLHPATDSSPQTVRTSHV
jgi:RNA polymerase sigma-70 factor (ECF subfamily)